MPWPSRIDYTQAVRDFPHISILDPKLKGGNPRRGSNNYLIAYSGGFSIVFPIEVLSNTYALRCWIADIGDAETRYEKISKYLEQRRLPYFVDFAYVPKGILVNGIKYSTTRMEWAEGETLCDFIEQNLQDARCLKTAAAEFQKMVETLHTHQISHGDLQDGNILFKRNGTDVKIKLIDYDSLFVPALRGQPDNIVGIPEYQHPQRIAGGGGANEKVDYFSELVIYLSLLSLAEKPDLWNQFGDRTEKGLLFIAEDFKNPDQSDVLRELENLSPDVKQLASKLKEFCKLSIDQLEPLEAVLPKISPAQVAYDLGVTYLHAQQYKAAIDEFKKAIVLDPNYKEAHHGLGLAHLKMGSLGEAKRAAEAALRIDPYYQPAHQLLDAIKSSSTSSVVTPPPPPTGISRPVSTNPTSQPSPSTGAPRPTPTNPASQSSPSTGTSRPTPTNPASQPSPSAGAPRPTPTNPTSQPAKPQPTSSNRWQYITGALAFVLVIWIVAFVIQMSEEDEVLRRKPGVTKPIHQTANGNNIAEERKPKVARREPKVAKQEHVPKPGAIEPTPQTGNEKGTENPIPITPRPASETGFPGQNRELQNQLTEGRTEQDEEIQTQIARAHDETVALRSQNQRLRDENEKLRSETRMLHNDNQRLHNDNTTLQKRLDELTQSPVESVPSPSYDQLRAEPLQEISHNVRPRVRLAAMSKNNQGCINFNRNQHRTAIKLFQDAIKNDPKSAIVHYNLGCTYLAITEYADAIICLDQAVALDPKFKEAHYNLALAFLRRGHRQAAINVARKALNIDNNYLPARQLLDAIE